MKPVSFQVLFTVEIEGRIAEGDPEAVKDWVLTAICSQLDTGKVAAGLTVIGDYDARRLP